MKFKKGQRVVVSARVGTKQMENQRGTIIDSGYTKNYKLIQFDNDIGGHDGEEQGQNGHCWIIDEVDVSIYNEWRGGKK